MGSIHHPIWRISFFSKYFRDCIPLSSISLQPTLLGKNTIYSSRKAGWLPLARQLSTWYYSEAVFTLVLFQTELLSCSVKKNSHELFQNIPHSFQEMSISFVFFALARARSAATEQA